MTGEAHAAERSARRAARSTPVRIGARIGIAAYGLTHLLVAWLALQIAFGTDGGERADQTGAFQAIVQQPHGRVLLWGLVVGFAAVALWRTQEAVWGFAYESERTTKVRLRATSAGKAVIFAVLAVLAARTAAGSGGGGGQQRAAAGVLGLPGGQLIVGAVGLGVLVTGAVTVVSGVQQRFRRAMSLPADRRAREAALRTGQVGFVAKGVAIGIVGVLVVIAAILYRPEEAGLDAALRTLAGQPFGQYLLVAIAFGVLAYGVFCFFDARYHRV
ncbi:DUF1206 domain-containing protein [Pseudonocardia sp. DSM 110487]|uniref:DUF1206 domain-containing protein n=1 Tax=Pseudonocardia sp. DSM 110487 TaxID=2865833 RepID=UPI001C6A3677|nr:DUF1206 domain-containing protein [Pseudonocardia sp. DSM 110487]QYN34652.1 DUF1206 domain-containing protein [Pseudonocardia sp. DSM 110487]